MARKSKLNSIFIAAVTGLLLLCIAITIGAFAIVNLNSTVSGTASLPNGMTARINGPFSCSEKSSRTEIQAGGHLYVFSPTTISIDGVPVAPLDATVADVAIDASFRSATLRINGNEVTNRGM